MTWTSARRNTGPVLLVLVALLACSAASDPAPAAGDTPAGPKPKTLSKTDVQALIQKAGTTPPDWWDSVPLEYPKSLDLSWPDKPPGPWNPQKNIGQYLWSVINENPGKWKSGVRFLHYLLTVFKDNPKKLAQTMSALGEKYITLLGDPARAAFWLQQADKREHLTVRGSVLLAECYWKLGSKAMALAELDTDSDYVTGGMAKLYAEMGDLATALKLARTLSDIGWPEEGYMVAAEACRLHGQFAQAMGYLEKVIALPATGQRAKRIAQVQGRARECLEAIKVFDALDLKRVPDGAYTGGSTSYAGPLQVEVTVKAGRIEAVRVTQHQDKQYFSALTETPAQIVEKQGVKGVDAVTSATVTSQAIINATAKALAKAMK